MKGFLSQIFLYGCLLLLPALAWAQQSDVDSLKAVLQKAQGKERVDALHELANKFLYSQAETADSLISLSGQLADKLNYTNGQARYLLEKGRLYNVRAAYPEAIEHYLASLKVYEKLGDKKQMAYVYNDIGIVYCTQNQDETCIEYFQKAQKIFEEIGELKGQAQMLNNLANIYADTEKEKAIEYFKRSLDIKIQLKNDSIGIANSLHNIGSVYGELGNYVEHQRYAEQALALYEVLAYQPGRVAVRNELAKCFRAQAQYAKALTYAQEAYQIAVAQQLPRSRQTAAYQLYEVYYEMKDYQKALEFFEINRDIKDSIFNEQTVKRIDRLRESFDLQQARSKNELLQKEKDLEKLQYQQKILLLQVGIVLLVAVALLVAAFLRKTQRLNTQLQVLNEELLQKNEEVKQQKEEITTQAELLKQSNNDTKIYNEALMEKNLELEQININVTASITYAQRIQTAVLPSEQRLREAFSDGFVLLLPKAIVSGDFYWFGQVGTQKIIAVVDCTGHGVPGAFMSLLADAFLNQIVIRDQITAPAAILARLHQDTQEILRQKESNNKDGMEISLCTIDEAHQVMHFAATRQPMLYFQEGQMHQLEGSAYPIGGGFYEGEAAYQFEQQRIDISTPTTVYLFSDGYRDQFQGAKRGHKFTMKRFVALLQDIHLLPMQRQYEQLLQAHLDWRGEAMQVDDILVLGFQV